MGRALAPLLFAALLVGGCGVHYHRQHYDSRSFYHDHRLRCGHYVSCRYYDRSHHFRPHHSHRDYFHRHRVRGYSVPCRVVHGRHYYRGGRR